MTCAAPRNFLKKSFPTENVIGNPMQMNILATSPNPQTCVRNLDNSSMETQIVVVSILLSRYAKDCSYTINSLWKMVESNHPLMHWLFDDEANIDWLKEYGVILHIEYGCRFERRHADARSIFDFVDDFRPAVGLEPKVFVNLARDRLFDYSDNKDVFQAYRDLLCSKWATSTKKPSWSGRMPPEFYINYQLKRQGKDTLKNDEGKYVAYTIIGSKGGRRRVSYSEGVRGGCEVH